MQSGYEYFAFTQHFNHSIHQQAAYTFFESNILDYKLLKTSCPLLLFVTLFINLPDFCFRSSIKLII